MINIVVVLIVYIIMLSFVGTIPKQRTIRCSPGGPKDINARPTLPKRKGEIR